MPAILDPDVLVDGLVDDVIDGLREELHPAFGVRAYRAFTVLRTWTGREVGDGKFSDVEKELRPQPRVWVWDGLRWSLEACGLNEMGEVKLTELSLRLTDADLAGPDLRPNQQWYIRLADAHGQGTPSRYFVHIRPSFVDREKDMGWVVWLKHVNIGGVG